MGSTLAQREFLQNVLFDPSSVNYNAVGSWAPLYRKGRDLSPFAFQSGTFAAGYACTRPLVLSYQGWGAFF